MKNEPYIDFEDENENVEIDDTDIDVEKSRRSGRRKKASSSLEKQINIACEKQKIHKCDFCGDCFTKSTQLDAHSKNVHGIQKTHKCKFCKKEYHTKNQLTNHI